MCFLSRQILFCFFYQYQQGPARHLKLTLDAADSLLGKCKNLAIFVMLSDCQTRIDWNNQFSQNFKRPVQSKLTSLPAWSLVPDRISKVEQSERVYLFINLLQISYDKCVQNHHLLLLNRLFVKNQYLPCIWFQMNSQSLV